MKEFHQIQVIFTFNRFEDLIFFRISNGDSLHYAIAAVRIPDWYVRLYCCKRNYIFHF